MLQSLGVDYVILGHSERREYFNETNQQLEQKVKAALAHGLVPIFCCGEPLALREANQQQEFVNRQLTESLFQLDDQSCGKLVLAYEPIWAIGTGMTASAETSPTNARFHPGTPWRRGLELSWPTKPQSYMGGVVNPLMRKRSSLARMLMEDL